MLVRGRVHAVRSTGSNVFIVLRQSFNTIQCVAFVKKDGLAKFVESTPKDSVVDVTATVVAAPSPIVSTSQQVLCWQQSFSNPILTWLVLHSPVVLVAQNFELHISKFFVISKAAPQLPFQLEDAARPEEEVRSPVLCALLMALC